MFLQFGGKKSDGSRSKPVEEQDFIQVCLKMQHQNGSLLRVK